MKPLFILLMTIFVSVYATASTNLCSVHLDGKRSIDEINNDVLKRSEAKRDDETSYIRPDRPFGPSQKIGEHKIQGSIYSYYIRSYTMTAQKFLEITGLDKGIELEGTLDINKHIRSNIVVIKNDAVTGKIQGQLSKDIQGSIDPTHLIINKLNPLNVEIKVGHMVYREWEVQASMHSLAEVSF